MQLNVVMHKLEKLHRIPLSCNQSVAWHKRQNLLHFERITKWGLQKTSLWVHLPCWLLWKCQTLKLLHKINIFATNYRPLHIYPCCCCCCCCRFWCYRSCVRAVASAWCCVVDWQASVILSSHRWQNNGAGIITDQSVWCMDDTTTFCWKKWICSLMYAFSALTLLVGWQEGHLACKRTARWDAGMVMCLGQDADLLVAQLMPLPLTISCSSKSRLVLPFWCRLTQVVPDKIQESRKMVVCVCECMCVMYFLRATAYML